MNGTEETAADVASLQHMLGDIDGDVAAEILRLEPSPDELETALLWLRDGSVAGEQPTEKTARIYDILARVQEAG